MANIDINSIPSRTPKLDGDLQVLGALAKGLGVQALSGIKGLSTLPRGADAAAKAIADYQAKYAPQLGAAGISSIQDVAPAYRSVQTSLPGRAVAGLSNAYGEGSQAAADLAGKYLGPRAAGVVGAAADAAPMAINDVGLLGAPAEALAKQAAREIPSIAARPSPQLIHAATMPYASHFSPLLEDGAHAGTLAREQAANARRAQDGLDMGEVPPSDFAGRQAIHEGAVAQRMAEPSPRVLSTADGIDSHLSGTIPDNATVHTAQDPETDAIMGHSVLVPRNGGLQQIETYVHPDFQRQGIGKDLLNRGVAQAHGAGLPFYGDTEVSAPQMANVAHSGHSVVFNPNVTEAEGKFGPALRSTDGQPVFHIPVPSSADDALPDDAQQGSWIQQQAFADGGSAGALAGGLGDLIKAYAPLKGMPTKAMIPGLGHVAVGPNQVARDAASAYMKEAGLPYNPPSTYRPADPVRGARIAAAFDAMPHAPQDLKVAASYDAMIKETLAQYQHMKNTGLNVEFMPHGQPDPYQASPRLAAEDVKNNNHLYVYPTEGGFGSGDAQAVAGNPLLGDSGEMFGDQPATNNDVFRAVHDYFGHIKEGVGFRANGEENAWRQHAGMYSDAARPAMTAETRGQNSWVNFGPHGPQNQVASSANTVFAPQKTGLLPDEFNSLDDPELHFLHMSNLSTPEATLDPKYYGTGIKGREAARGGTKVTSLYPADIDPSDIETGLRGKTPYRVSVPASSMYDANKDPLSLKDSAMYNGNLDMNDYEDAINGAGYAGYHVPDADGLLRGQGRLFGKTPATRLGPGPAPAAADEDLASGFADGGEVGTALSGLGDMIAHYAPEADTLAKHVAEHGGVTYNPTSGDIHTSGYAVPTASARSTPLDSAPTAHDIHDFMMSNQDAFDEDPSAALHVHSDDDGNHYMHVAHITPDFGDAADKAGAAGVPGFGDLATGDIHPASPVASAAGNQSDSTAPAVDPQSIEDYLAGPKMIAGSWNPGVQSVGNPKRPAAFPGVYNDPRQIVQDATSKVGAEDPLLQRLFGVSRRDLSDLALSRQGNELGVLPGAKANPQGAKAALGVMTPQNTQRLVDVLDEARSSPSLYQGMTGWYSMDPLYARFRELYGDDLAPEKYRQFNTLSGMASPGSDVGTEIARGTAANWLHTEGRFGDFVRHGGGVEDTGGAGSRPADMAELPGHVYHRTAQAIPMQQYLESGEMQMKSPKVPMYIQASGVPETGFQTNTPVGDAHWARGVGLADTRGDRTSKGQPVVPGSSVSTPEMQTLAPWWQHRVASQVGLESVPAQALLWGAMSPYTGVKSAIGAPKLEILSTQIGKLANRLGISPETARDMVIQGKAGAFRDGGRAP